MLVPLHLIKILFLRKILFDEPQVLSSQRQHDTVDKSILEEASLSKHLPRSSSVLNVGDLTTEKSTNYRPTRHDFVQRTSDITAFSPPESRQLSPAIYAASVGSIQATSFNGFLLGLVQLKMFIVPIVINSIIIGITVKVIETSIDLMSKWNEWN